MIQDSQNSSANRWLICSGWFLFVVGILHLFVWLVKGGEWAGPVSWRKPILFGISTGMTLVSFGWIYTKLTPRRYDAIALPLLAISLVAEVALITIQQWRGVASHFNNSTQLDAAIDFWMTVLIALASIVILDLSIRCFVSLSSDNAMNYAIRSGIAFLLVSIAIGFLISVHGHYQVSMDRDPTKYGESGVTKFPHGVAIHAIQLFPMIAFLMRRAGIVENARLVFLQHATYSMTFFLAFSAWQTLLGFDRFQINLVGSSLLLLAMAILSFGIYKTCKSSHHSAKADFASVSDS